MPQAYRSQFNAKSVHFSMQDHLMMIEVDNEFAQARITTHGASVLSYTPKKSAKGAQDLLWVSSSAVYNGQKAVRGGIPVCWPWFGKAKSAGLPAHGFVRNLVWHLDQVADLESGVTEVVLSCQANEHTLAIWPHKFHLQLRIEIGEKLILSLTTTNLNAYDLEITEALHTYFNVADPRGLVIHGLENSTHLDKLNEQVPAEIQQQPVVLHPPMDSVYLNQTGEVTLEDIGHKRRILIENRQTSSAVVWNPGPEIVKGFDDITEEGWLEFACVESGNVLNNAVIVPAEQKHTFSVILSALAI